METHTLRQSLASLVALAAFSCAGLPATAADQDGGGKTPLPADLAFAPADAMVVIALNVGPHWNGPEADAIKKLSQMHRLVLTSEAKNLEKLTGLKPEQFERVVLIGPDLGTYVFIVTCRQAFDLDGVLRALVPESKKEKARQKSYFTSEKSGYALYPVDARTFLVGPVEDVESFLHRPPPAAGIPRKLAKAAAKNTFLVAEFDRSGIAGALHIAGDRAEPFRPLAEAKLFRVTVEASDGVQVTLRAEFSDEEAAAKGLPALKKVLEAVDGYFALLEAQLPAFLKEQQEQHPGAKGLSARMGAMFKATRAGLKGAPVQQDGNVAKATVLIQTKEPATTAVLLLSMMPRGAKKKE